MNYANWKQRFFTVKLPPGKIPYSCKTSRLMFIYYNNCCEIVKVEIPHIFSIPAAVFNEMVSIGCSALLHAGKDLSPAGFPGPGNGIFKAVITPEQLAINNKGRTAENTGALCALGLL